MPSNKRATVKQCEACMPAIFELATHSRRLLSLRRMATLPWLTTHVHLVPDTVVGNHVHLATRTKRLLSLRGLTTHS